MNNVSNKNDDYIIIAERRYNDVKAEIMAPKIYASRHYVWCPKCKKRMDYDDVIPRSDGKYSYTHLCSCGHLFQSTYAPEPAPEHKDVAIYKVEYLSINEYPLKGPDNKIYENVSYDAAQNKLTIMATFMQMIPGEVMVPEIFNRKIILHLSTGKAFLVTDKRPDRKRCFGARSASTIVNITNTGFTSAWIFSEEMVNIFLDEYMSRKNVDPADMVAFVEPESNCVCENDAKILFCMLHNCHPNLIYTFDSYTDEICVKSAKERHHADAREILKFYPKELIDSEQLLHKIILGMKIPTTKRFMKLYRENILNAQRVYRLKCMGFTDLNLIYTLSQMWICGNYELKAVTRLVKEMIKTSGEKHVCRKILATKASWSVIDAARAYERIINHDASLLPKHVFCNNTKDIHDILTKISNTIHDPNKDIKYSDKEYMLEDNIDNISFTLAKDTDELIKIGADMRICVADYRYNALKKRCTILSMTNSNGKYVGCIELRRGRLVQAKAFANKMLCNEAADALKKWVSKNEIRTENCDDYNAILEQSA